MANVKQTIRLLVLVLAGMTITTAAVWAQNPATPGQSAKPISETRSASCLLQVVTDPSILSLNEDTIRYLFDSSGVRDRAVQEVLGVTGELASNLDLGVQVLQNAEVTEPLKENRILLKLWVNLPSQDWKPAARELMAAVIANFRKSLEVTYQNEAGRLNDQGILTTQEVDRAEAELVRTQKDLLDISQQDLSSQAIRSRITAFTSELQSVRLENASKESYRKAIEMRIAEIRQQMEASLREDAIAAELQRIVQRRMEELKRVQEVVKTAAAASTELDAVEDKLATARIDLARRREELSKTGVAGSLEKLTGELGTLTLEAVQARTKEHELEIQLKEAGDLLPRAAEYERMMLRLDVAKQNMQEAMIQHNKAQQRVRMLQTPSVSVIGG